MKRSPRLQSGVLGALKEVYAWSNRPIWAQGPDRRMTMEKFAAQAKEEDPEEADKIVEAKKKEIARDLDPARLEELAGCGSDA